MKERLNTLCDYTLQWIEHVIRAVITPFFIVWEILKLLAYPLMWLWTFFQLDFIFNFYILRKYFNLDYNTLLRYNITLNHPSRQSSTTRNKIYRWCTFKIFERNNWTYAPIEKKGRKINEVLKQKIADMQKAIDELSAALEESAKVEKEILNNY